MSLRITSEFWVAALVRRAFGSGGFAAVVRRGSAEAGAIFVIARTRLGEQILFGPAPQATYEEGRPSERLFVELVRTVDGADISSRLAKEERFDPDFWVVEVELDAALLKELVPVRTP
jgi:hypothetical protein